MPRKTIRLFAEDGGFMAWTTTEDAACRVRSEMWDEVWNGNSFQGLRKRPNYRGSNGSSPSSITAKEMRAAVGATQGGSYSERGVLLPNKDERQTAVNKIRAWPEITDSDQAKDGKKEAPKAVTIVAGVVFQPAGFKSPKLDPHQIFCFA